jgi:4-hydroxybenzoate polyprenyltransferase
MGRFGALVRCSHPEPVVAVTAVASILALSVGRGAGTVWVALAVLAGQLFVGWSNDYLDRQRDRAAGRADKPLARAQIEPRQVRVAAIAAVGAAVPLSLASGLAAAGVHFVAIAAATAYNLGLKATLISALPYTVAFALLPAFVTLGLPAQRWPPAWALAAGALIGTGAHFTQVLPDIDRDRSQNLLGLPQRLGARASAIAAALLLATAATVIAVGTRNAVPALVTVPPALAVILVKPNAAFRLTLVTAGLALVAFLLSGSSLAGGQ